MIPNRTSVTSVLVLCSLLTLPQCPKAFLHRKSRQNPSKASSLGLTTGSLLLSSLMKKALSLGRVSKWNEFMEEQEEKLKQQQQEHLHPVPVPQVIPLPLQVSSSSSSPIFIESYNKNQSKENLIDETKDPNSPYYISMISSNIGGSFSSLKQNLSQASSTTKTSVNESPVEVPSSLLNGDTSASSVTKQLLFPITSQPSRVHHTTKHPLINSINVSNLEQDELPDQVEE